ncbi:hypothetical protein [Xylophilus sp. GOD-11R]|nr:hypothetical protein [Xylophilus sp. GOD-11R]WPB57622.1 hypothetical protein R9X41_02925 [Xylophilus sp. GOD-11R]
MRLDQADAANVFDGFGEDVGDVLPAGASRQRWPQVLEAEYGQLAVRQ